jgi:predicted kinase
MRDRGKRRKQQPNEQSTQEKPEPLQPRFPERQDTNELPQEAAPEPSPEVADEAGGMDDPLAPETAAADGEEAQQPARSQRSRRRGRRGRGARPATPGEAKTQAATHAPRLPAPGGPTGEAAEAEAPSESERPTPAPAQSAAASKSKGAVVLSIGLPGSGKSTWFKRHNIFPLSSDMVRILLFDDVTEQRFQDLVFSTLRSMLRARLLAKRPWNYVDATNLSPHERRSWVKLAHDFGYEAHAVFFDVPAEVCMERNQRRDRNVPEDVMRRMASKLRAPKFEEGFAKITVVRLKKKDGEAGAAVLGSSQPEMAESNPDDVPKVVDSEY